MQAREGMVGGPTIKGLDAREVLLPADVLAIDVTEVGDEEGVLFSRLTEFMVNILHAVAEGVANQFFG